MRRLVPITVLCAACGGEGAWEPVWFAKGIPFLEATVEDDPTVCLVDTGASGTVVRSDLAGDELATLEFADRSVTEAVSRDSAYDDLFVALSATADAEVGCVLGMDVIRSFSMTLDYTGERIRFSKPRKDAWEIDDLQLGEPIVLELRDTPIPSIRASFDGVQALAALDTGATELHLEPHVLDALDPRPVTLPTQVSTPDGLLLGVSGTLPQLRIGGTAYTDLPFTSYGSEQLALFAEDGFAIEAVVGAVFLEQFAVTFDGRRNELVLQPY